MYSLTLKYTRDPYDDFALLFAILNTKSFSGNVSFWSQWQDLEELGESLKTYPIASEAPITKRWGCNHCIGDDLVIGLSIKPFNRLGTLLVLTELADHYDLSQRLKASFKTDYSSLDNFGKALRRMMNGNLEEATLSGF